MLPSPSPSCSGRRPGPGPGRRRRRRSRSRSGCAGPCGRRRRVEVDELFAGIGEDDGSAVGRDGQNLSCDGDVFAGEAVGGGAEDHQLGRGSHVDRRAVVGDDHGVRCEGEPHRGAQGGVGEVDRQDIAGLGASDPEQRAVGSGRGDADRVRGDGLAVAEETDVVIRGGIAGGRQAERRDRGRAGEDRSDGAGRGSRNGDGSSGDVGQVQTGEVDSVLVQCGHGERLGIVLIDDGAGHAPRGAGNGETDRDGRAGGEEARARSGLGQVGVDDDGPGLLGGGDTVLVHGDGRVGLGAEEMADLARNVVVIGV